MADQQKSELLASLPGMDLFDRAPIIYRLAKKDLTLTVEEVATLQTLAFEDPDEIDFEEDENAAKLFGALSKAAKSAQEREELERKRIFQERKDEAIAYLASQNVDVDNLPDYVIEGMIYALEPKEVSGEDADEVEVLTNDDDELILVTPAGDIVAFIDAPPMDVERRNILEWAGERMQRARARKAGLESERQHWIDRVNAQFNTEISKQQRIADGVEYLYTPVAKAYLDDIRAAFIAKHKDKENPPKPPASAKVGLLKVVYSTTKPKIEVFDEALAVEFLTEEAPDAVKTEKSVRKSMIPLDVKAKLTKDKSHETGLFAYPGGDQEFEFK